MRIVLSWLVLAGAAHTAPAVAQRTDVAGVVTVTNRGISLIPSFTLGKPAAIFDIVIRKHDLSFEPQFRVGLNGKPWSFIFWGRYRVLSGGRFRLGVGAHPAVLFRTTTDTIVATRYLAGEVVPSYALAENLSVGAYYLYSRKLERGAGKHTHMLAARATVTNIRISDRYFVQVAPQLYYLNTDRGGVYVNSSLMLADRKLGLSISAMVNEPLRTRIAEAEDFLWNVSVMYAIR